VRAPVLVYVHGGGFVTGDKTSPGSPFYDNIGQWAARRGWIGVTLTYRLAPAHRWPCGPADMALAVAWLRANIAGYGGDPQNIFLVGQSAGAAHVAAYVAHDRFHRGGVGIAGAVMMSGLFDLTSQTSNPYIDAYFGGDYQAVADAASIAGLLATPLPLLFTVSELDPAAFQDQAAMLVHAWHGQKHELPRLAYLAGHNHISPGLCLGTAEDQLARCIAQFVETFGTAAAAADLNPKAMAHQPKA
jgi:triacylglycerol lipase